MLSENEQAQLHEACKLLPRPTGNYLVDDYVTNLMLTVLDFQLKTKIVETAHAFYVENRWSDLRTLSDLKACLAGYPDDKEGNTELAQYLWGYRYWNRAELLRRLAAFFEAEGVVTQSLLVQWARTSEFEKDFQGRIPGLAYAVYKWLVMRQGIETVKPDVHVRRFVEATLGRNLSDVEIVSSLEAAASELGVKAYELDWAIWETQRQGT